MRQSSVSVPSNRTTGALPASASLAGCGSFAVETATLASFDGEIGFTGSLFSEGVVATPGEEEHAANGKRWRIDSRHILWVPRRTEHADESVTALYDTLALYPSPSLFASSLADADLGGVEHERLTTRYVLFARTRLFDDLLEDWFYA